MSMISGVPPFPIRNDEVRAGGDEPNRTFFATGSHLQVMQQNNYLWVSGAPVPAMNDTYYCYYYYPDTFSHNTSKLGKILPASRIPPYQTNTTVLIRDLLLNIFSSLYSNYASFDTAVSVVVDYVSVHPYTDFNGRTCRFIGWLISLTDDQYVMQTFLSDLDLVTSPSGYQAFVRASSDKYFALKKAMLNEMLRKALRLGQKAQDYDYYNLTQWFDLWNSLKVFGIQLYSPNQITQKHLDMIAARQWIPLLDSLAGGQQWRPRTSPGFDWRNH